MCGSVGPVGTSRRQVPPSVATRRRSSRSRRSRAGGDGAEHRRAERGRLRRRGDGELAAGDVGVDLHQQPVALAAGRRTRRSASTGTPAARTRRRSRASRRPSPRAARGRSRCARVASVIPTSRPAQIGVDEHRAVAVPPVEREQPALAGPQRRRLLLEHVWTSVAAACAPPRGTRAARRARRTRRRCRRPPTGPPRSRSRPGTTPSSTTPHIPSTSASSVAEQDVAVARAHDHDHRPGLRHRRRRQPSTCASTFATATGVPGRRPVQRRGPLAQRRRRGCRAGRSRRDIFSSTTCSKRGSSAAKYASRREARRASTTSPCSRRCSCCASRRRSAARRSSRRPRSAGRRARRPRAPRRGSAAPSRRTTRTRSCRRSAASHGSPRSVATALMRSASGCAAWCFQSFTHACGSRAQVVEQAERRAVGESSAASCTR